MAKKTKRVRDWGAIIDKLNNSKSGRLKIELGSPGSSQVTRCRLLREYRNLLATTKGRFLHLTVVGAL